MCAACCSGPLLWPGWAGAGRAAGEAQAGRAGREQGLGSWGAPVWSQSSAGQWGLWVREGFGGAGEPLRLGVKRSSMILNMLIFTSFHFSNFYSNSVGPFGLGLCPG